MKKSGLRFRLDPDPDTTVKIKKNLIPDPTLEKQPNSTYEKQPDPTIETGSGSATLALAT